MPSRKRARQSIPAVVSTDHAIRASKLRLVGVALICAYVALVPLVFDPAADWPFVVPKALLTHALAYVLVGIMAALVVRFGRHVFAWSRLHVPVLAFLVVNVLAAALAQDRLLALFGSHTRMLGLGTIAAWTVLYFAVFVLIRTQADLIVVVVAGLSAAALMLGYEFVQVRGWDPFPWNVDSAARPFSTNGQPTTLAAYFTVLAVSSLAGAVGARELSRWARGALFVFSGLLIAGMAATATRSALIGLASGSAVLVGLVWLRNPGRRARSMSAAAAAVVTIAVAGVLTFSPIGSRLIQSEAAVDGSEDANIVQLDLASLDVRAVLYQVAIDAVRERPLLGYGPDNFVVAMTRHRPEQGPNEARLTYATNPHSWIAQTATGSGLLGLGVFLSIIATAVVLTVRSPFRAVTAAAAAALAAYLGTGLTSVNDVGSDWVFWFALALIARSPLDVSAPNDATAQVSRRVNAKGMSKTSAPWRRSPIVAAILVAVGIGMALTTAQAMAASHAAGQSRDSRLHRRVSQAVDLGIAATSSDPGRAEYWHTLGLAYVAAARWREAANALERAVALAPWDVRDATDLVATQLVLANDGDAGARARAVQLVDDAVRRDPNYPAAQYTRAVVMQFIGNIPEGLRSIERALALSPHTTNAQWYVIATQLYVAAGRAADGVRVARDGFFATDSQQIRIELARALLASGQPQEALAQVDGVLAAEPGNTAAQRLRAEILAAIPK